MRHGLALVRPPFFSRCGSGCKSALFGADLIWRLVSVALLKPCIVVLSGKGRQAQSQLLNGGEEAHPKQLFLKHANGALRGGSGKLNRSVKICCSSHNGAG